MGNLTQKAEELIERYLAGNCTEQERILVERVYLKRMLQDGPDKIPVDLTQIGVNSWKYIQLAITDNPVRIKFWPGIASAAAVLLIAAAGFWFYNDSNNKTKLSDKVSHILPGKKTAILALANGETIRLSEAKTGLIINVNKLEYNDGTEVPLSQKTQIAGKMLTLSTPRGGTYEVILPDGTKVWLNAESTLKFPSTFSHLKSRTVYLLGEAYFEVSKVNVAGNAGLKAQRMPFVVQSRGQMVEVLGTHFNINSYVDENNVKTTLLEGAVKVSSLSPRANAKDLDSLYPRNDKENRNVVLGPGEQSIVAGNNIHVEKVDTDEMLAWKNGYFKFVAEDMESIMRKIARWYNVEIVFANNIPNGVFSGRISRSKNIDQVLRMIESANSVHFKIEGRRIVVVK